MALEIDSQMNLVLHGVEEAMSEVKCKNCQEVKRCHIKGKLSGVYYCSSGSTMWEPAIAEPSPAIEVSGGFEEWWKDVTPGYRDNYSMELMARAAWNAAKRGESDG